MKIVCAYKWQCQGPVGSIPGAVIYVRAILLLGIPCTIPKILPWHAVHKKGIYFCSNITANLLSPNHISTYSYFGLRNHLSPMLRTRSDRPHWQNMSSFIGADSSDPGPENLSVPQLCPYNGHLFTTRWTPNKAMITGRPQQKVPFENNLPIGLHPITAFIFTDTTTVWTHRYGAAVICAGYATCSIALFTAELLECMLHYIPLSKIV